MIPNMVEMVCNLHQLSTPSMFIVSLSGGDSTGCYQEEVIPSPGMTYDIKLRIYYYLRNIMLITGSIKEIALSCVICSKSVEYFTKKFQGMHGRISDDLFSVLLPMGNHFIRKHHRKARTRF